MNLDGKIKKTQALSGRLVKSSGGGGSIQEIYWVQYGVGTATNAEVNEAVAANKLPICYWDSTDAYGRPRRTLYFLIRNTPTESFFSGVDYINNTIIVRRLYADAWDTQTIRYEGKLTWDTTPRFGSQNPVTSGGIYQALQNVSVAADSALSTTSENPVQNRVVTMAINEKYTKPSGGIPASDLASGVIPSVPSPASSGTPAMDGTASRGSSAQYARADHRHPTDTSRAAASDLAAKADKITEVTVSADGAVSQALDAGKIYHFTGALTALTVTLNAPASGQLAQYHFDFNSGSTAATLTMPNTVTMPNSFTVEASEHYEVDVLNNYGAVMAWANS